MRVYLFLLAGAISAGCGGGPAQTCRGAGSGCAVSNDCCSSFICLNSVCTTPLACRSVGQACAVAADCCSGLACSKTCVAPPSPPTCSAPVSCTGGRSYKSCSTGTSTYYKCSDGTVFTCATASNCAAATAAVAAWCSATSSCRTAGQTCSPSAGCCSSLICSGGACTNPATCRNQGQSCAFTSDCCGQLVCYSGSCEIAGMTWSLTNNSISGIYVRFYDESTNPALVWPDSTNAYTLDVGQTVDIPLACTPGHQICYGAEDDAFTGYWGVGLDNANACTSCCYSCDGQTHPIVLQ